MEFRDVAVFETSCAMHEGLLTGHVCEWEVHSAGVDFVPQFPFYCLADSLLWMGVGAEHRSTSWHSRTHIFLVLSIVISISSWTCCL